MRKVLVKIFNEIDCQTELENKRNNLKASLRLKNKLEKNDYEIQNQLNIIERENEKIFTYHDHKLELIKECSYLIDYHLNKTNEIIKNYEKNVQNNLINGTLALNEDKSDKAGNYLEDQAQQTFSSKTFFFISNKPHLIQLIFEEEKIHFSFLENFLKDWFL